MRYPVREPFIANTDASWFDFLASKAMGDRLDEVNFWLPRAVLPMKTMNAGEPVFFRRKRPDYAVAGYGFFATFAVIDLETAWSVFTWKNGDPDKRRFFERIGAYRGVNLLDSRSRREPLGCTVLRDAHFWPRDRWIPWGRAEGWHQNIVQGKTEREPSKVARLMAEWHRDAELVPEDLADDFLPLDLDERQLAVREITEREGQGAFRLRLLQAYDRQCAITGEHTEPVLDAAHIQPYLGPRSNHVQNGIVMTKEFHALFDRGYVAITPDYEVQISEQLRAEWQNGKRYYPYHGKRLVQVPAQEVLRPSREALEWHFRHVFLKTA